jgi:PAS domain S-box-containing protein
LVFGYAESEILFRTSAILWTPEDRERGDVEKEMRIAEREGRAADEREHLRKDGSRFWASGVLAPIRGEDGSLQGFVKVMRDVSDRRKAEEALRSSNQELEQFAYAASHDMREPLRTVNSYAQMLQRRYGSSLDADGQAFLAFVQSGVQHMQRLLADLLAYSHLLHEKSERRRAVPLDDVLAQVLLNARGTIRETSAVITSDPLPVVLGDESQLAQVLENLIGNALKYQPAGNRPVVHVSARREDNHWTISVRDNGIGFEQEYVDRIFVLFRRLHRDQYPGSGIGLAVSKRIVEHHGGRIWAESSPGAGSTFHFTLPAG